MKRILIFSAVFVFNVQADAGELIRVVKIAQVLNGLLRDDGFSEDDMQRALRLSATQLRHGQQSLNLPDRLAHPKNIKQQPNQNEILEMEFWAAFPNLYKKICNGSIRDTEAIQDQAMRQYNITAETFLKRWNSYERDLAAEMRAIDLSLRATEGGAYDQAAALEDFAKEHGIPVIDVQRILEKHYGDESILRQPVNANTVRAKTPVRPNPEPQKAKNIVLPKNIEQDKQINRKIDPNVFQAAFTKHFNIMQQSAFDENRIRQESVRYVEDLDFRKFADDVANQKFEGNEQKFMDNPLWIVMLSNLFDDLFPDA